MDQKPLLFVKDLVKHFPVYRGILRKQVGVVKAVDGISFSLFPGEIVGIVGESGCGKSTVAKSAIRLIEPTSGQIEFEGINLTQISLKKMRQLRKDIQIVFQDPYASLNPRKTVLDLIGEGLLYHGIVSKEDVFTSVCAVLDQVGISSDSILRYPHEFSGGQQQRICIGRAIALSPKLVILDEAIASLDVSIQAQILNLLYELKMSLGLSYLFISHDLSVIRHFCDRVLVLYYGKVVEEGCVEEVFSHPKHPYTQKLLRAIPPRHPSLKVKNEDQKAPRSYQDHQVNDNE